MSPLALRLILGFLGLGVCFRGAAAFRLALVLGGALLGGVLAATQYEHLPVEPEWLAPSLVLLAAVVSAVAIKVIYRVAILVLGAIAAMATLLAVPDLLPADTVERLLLLAGCGLLGALLARFAEKIGLALLTAAAGSLLTVSVLFREPLAGESLLPAIDRTSLVFRILWVALFVAGVVVQLKGPARRPPE